MRKNQALTREQRGQAIVLVALMALVLVAFVGLALDGGQIYGWRRGMQNAADAGAVAGAYSLTLGANNAQVGATVQQYAVVANRADLYDYSIQESCVTVSTTKNFPALFIGVIGIDNLDAKARATACAGQPAGGFSDLWPFAATVFSYSVDTTYPLSITNMNWLCFDNGNCSASDLSNWITNGFNGTYYQLPDVGSSKCTGADPQLTQLIPPACLVEKPGQSTMTGQLYDPVCTAPNRALNRSFTVPLFDVCVSGGSSTPCSTSGNNLYHIVGFGRFHLVGMRVNNSNGAQNGCYYSNGVVLDKGNLPTCPGGVNTCIWGKFEQYVDYHDICVSNCQPYTGTLSVILTN